MKLWKAKLQSLSIGYIMNILPVLWKFVANSFQWQAPLFRVQQETGQNSKLVVITQCAASKRAFPKRRLDRNENTNSDTESHEISKEWAIVSAMRGPAVLRDHDSRWYIFRTSALFQRLRSTVNRVSNSSRFPPQQYQTHQNATSHDNYGLSIQPSPNS